MLAQLVTWWKGQAPLDVSHLRVRVYTREECGCCHKAIALLQEFQGRFRFDFDLVDIDRDETLRARFNEQVPVIEIDGKVRFRGIVNPVLLERLLRAEVRGN